MDFVKKFTGQGENANANTQHGQGHSSSSGGGGFMDSLNNKMGGGASGEKKEADWMSIDLAVDFVQERMGGGDQSNESAVEQAKDEQISDAIRRQYKNMTGKEFPIKDKE
ncbi:hypothetical protein DFH09DRAFT_934412 [Mycena vulgaris]|nr:hypothetical protein DFH09DRAFT_934412 [Mycena vulgaris]